MTLSNTISAWSPSSPKTSIGCNILMPGVSISTNIMDCCECLGPSNLVLPNKTPTLHSGRIEPEIHHL